MSRHFRKSSLALLALLLLLLIPGEAEAYQEQAAVNALMIGNSWLSGAAQHLINLSEGSGDIWASQVIHGGYNLKNHWTDPEQMAQIRSELSSGIYDYAVILDFASLVYDPEGGGFHATYVKLFDELITSYGVQTVIMVPWTDEFTPNAQQALTANEYAIAAEIGAVVAPVGAAFARSEALYPEIMLKKSPEDSHPSIHGAYLREMVLYATLLEKSPEGLAGQFGISEEEEQQLKDVAWETVLSLNYGQNPPPAPTQPAPSPTQPPAATATPTLAPSSTATAPPATATSAPSETPAEISTGPTVTEAQANAAAGKQTATALAAAPQNPGPQEQPSGENGGSQDSETMPDYSRTYRIAILLFAGGIGLLGVVLLVGGVLYLRRQ